MPLSKENSVPITFWFRRREGETPHQTLWQFTEWLLRDGLEGTIWELVHTEAVGFERGEGVTQWP